MPFDLATAKPATGGFDLSTAKPAGAGSLKDQYASDAQAYIEAKKQERIDAAKKEGKRSSEAMAAGIGLGVSDIGNTALNLAAYLPGKVIPSVAQWNRTRNADFDAITDQYRDSGAFKTTRTVGNIASTAPVGGILGKTATMAAPLLIRAGLSAPVAAGLANSLATGGFRAGATTGATNLAVRAAGGAITGGVSAGVINPETAGTGALIGGVLPVGVKALGSGAGYVGGLANSLVQPFTKSGQDAIAGKIIRKFAEGAPTPMNAAELVPGSLPTLAEATGNAGIATFQRGVRDMSPNAFVVREQANAGARNALFDSAAGDVNKLNAAVDARDATANALYKRAGDSDAMRRQITQEAAVQQSALDYARRGGMGRLPTADQAAAGSLLPSAALQDLNSRSTFKSAVQEAKKLAQNKGENIGNPLTSIKGLHYVKLALDDMLETSPTNALARNAKSGVMDTKEKLMDEIAKISPQYGVASSVYGEMSQPINAMQALQGLKLTDAQGNITLSKVKTAIEKLTADRNAPGIHIAKSIQDEQMAALTAIHDDLLRQTNLGAGRSIGSNSFQNIATDNILSSLLPGKIGEIIGGKAGGVVGQVGKLAYSGPNEAIRNRLVEMTLQPQLAAPLLRPVPPAIPGRVNALLEAGAPALFRAAPVLSSSR